MAIDVNAYTTVANIERLIGDLVNSRVFSTTTIPTKVNIEDFINEIADELNGILKANGYTVPVLLVDDVEAYGMLLLANTVGVGALVLTTHPVGSFTDMEEELVGTTRYQTYAARYKRILQLIQDRRLPATKLFTDSFKAYAGSRTDRDTGETKVSLFTRSKDDFPGARSLQE